MALGRGSGRAHAVLQDGMHSHAAGVLPTVVGEAVPGEVGTTVIGYVLTHAPPVFACQPVAWSGQAAPALPVLLIEDELDA
jgi:hypothetical protein